MQLDEFYLIIAKKEQKSSQILNCKHLTYMVNILKFEYLPLGKL